MVEQALYKHEGFFEPIPSKVIADVQINTQMGECITDPNLKLWFQKDFLLQHAAFFSVGSVEIGVRLLQPPTMYRGALLQYGLPVFDEYGSCYLQMGVKGSGIAQAGIKFFSQGETVLSKQRQVLIDHPDPIGFFGYNGSLLEEQVSNTFAAYGGRNRRVIAHLVLNHKEFLQWYEGLHFRTAYPIQENLEKVEQNDDNAVIMVNLMGTERLSDYLKAKGKGKGIFNWLSMYENAARLFVYEITKNGLESVSTKYGIIIDPEQLSKLSKLASGEMTEGNLDVLFNLQTHLLHRNIEICQRMSVKLYDSKLSAHITPHNIDFAGYIYDWERGAAQNKATIEEQKTLIDDLMLL